MKQVYLVVLAVLFVFTACDSGGTTDSDFEKGFVLITAGADPLGNYSLTNDFYMSITEVTQGEWRALMGAPPNGFAFDGCPGETNGNCPAEQISWFDAIAYANAKSIDEGFEQCYDSLGNVIDADAGGDPTACDGYRLPTGDEWEYAARAGSTGDYSTGNHSVRGIEEVTVDNLGDYAWYCRGYPNCDVNSEGTTHPVGTKAPNAFGLYDMHGNVSEWTLDSLDSNHRGLRGGSWGGNALLLRLAGRAYSIPSNRISSFGFRLLRTAL